jgi:hypothetical protein
MDHPNVQPFNGYDDNPAFGPFGALVSPVSSPYFTSIFALTLPPTASGAQEGMPVAF